MEQASSHLFSKLLNSIKLSSNSHNLRLISPSIAVVLPTIYPTQITFRKIKAIQDLTILYFNNINNYWGCSLFLSGVFPNGYIFGSSLLMASLQIFSLNIICATAPLSTLPFPFIFLNIMLTFQCLLLHPSPKALTISASFTFIE